MRKEAPAEKDMSPFDGKPRTVQARVRRTTLDGRKAPTEVQEETMKVKLNVDYAVCLDGVHPSSFPAGSEVDMPMHIAPVLLEDGRASLPSETKMEKTVPKNKMLDGSPENKTIRKAGKK